MIGYLLTAIFISRILSTNCDNFTTAISMTEINRELEREFNGMDDNSNQLVDLQEFDSFVHEWDTDKDGCVEVAEYNFAHQGNPRTFQWAMFNHFDHNNDTCLEIQDMVDEFHAVDIDPKNGNVTMNELKAYYDRLYTKLGLVGA